MRICALPVLVALGIAGCGGGESGGGGQGALATDACETAAIAALAGKTMALDKAVFAGTLAAQSDGSHLLKGPVTVQPGLVDESKQTLECSVRFTAGKDAPDVLRVQFIW